MNVAHVDPISTSVIAAILGLAGRLSWACFAYRRSAHRDTEVTRRLAIVLAGVPAARRAAVLLAWAELERAQRSGRRRPFIRRQP